MDLSDLHPAPGSRKDRKRIGRGYGSGHGKTSGFGQKGQKSRTGHHKAAPHFQGGQTQISTQLPYKRGFKNRFRVAYQVVNLENLDALETELEVTPEVLAAAGLVRDLRKPIKVLGDGELTKALKITAHRFSASAKSAIEAAGGTATLIGGEEAAADNSSSEAEGGR